jgi:ribosomal protein L11 methyltransferase
MKPQSDIQAGVPGSWPALKLQVDAGHAEWLDLALQELDCQGAETLAESSSAISLKAYFLPGRKAGELRRQLISAWHRMNLPAQGLQILASEAVAPRNWVAEWRSQYRPIRVGRSFLIAPSWHRSEWPQDLIRIRMDPQNAFGSGTHASTRLCLMGIEEYYQPGLPALDIGTGSGILAIAMGLINRQSSRKQPAGRLITAIDCDGDAVETARKNARRNGVGALIRFLAVPADRYDQESAALVAANLTALDLRQQAVRLTSLCRPGGILLLSGLQVSDVREVRGALQEAGCRWLKSRRQEGWTLLVMKRP